MLFAQERFHTGEVLWSIFWFFLFFLWIWLLITIFADIFRARDMSGWAKALWTIGIIILPFLGVLMYLIVNGNNMNKRAEDDARAADDAMRAYIRDTTGSTSDPTAELRKLADLHDSGVLSDEEYASAKAKIAAG